MLPALRSLPPRVGRRASSAVHATPSRAVHRSRARPTTLAPTAPPSLLAAAAAATASANTTAPPAAIKRAWACFATPASAWRDRLRAHVHALRQRQQRSPFVLAQYAEFVRRHPEYPWTGLVDPHYAPLARTAAPPSATFSYLRDRLQLRNDPQTVARRNHHLVVSLLRRRRRQLSSVPPSVAASSGHRRQRRDHRVRTNQQQQFLQSRASMHYRDEASAARRLVRDHCHQVRAPRVLRVAMVPRHSRRSHRQRQATVVV